VFFSWVLVWIEATFEVELLFCCVFLGSVLKVFKADTRHAHPMVTALYFDPKKNEARAFILCAGFKYF